MSFARAYAQNIFDKVDHFKECFHFFYSFFFLCSSLKVNEEVFFAWSFIVSLLDKLPFSDSLYLLGTENL